MKRPRMNVTRKVLMWFFSASGTAYVTINLGVDFTRGGDYLEEVNASLGEGECRVSVHHLMCAAVTRVLSESPDANARIVGRRIEQPDHVGVAMPVNLIGHEGGARFETALLTLERADTMSLREIAAACRRDVKQEREGRSTNAFVRVVTELVDRAPTPVVSGLLSGLDRLGRIPAVARQVQRQADVTCAVSNVGATMRQLEGAWFRGSAMTPPQLDIFHLGTVWGLSAVQDEAVPVDGEVKVRPVLPVILLFDHRLIDGVRASQLATRLVELLQAPEAFFGEAAEVAVGA